MPVKQSLSDQRIIDYLQAHYGIKVVTLTFLPLGADTIYIVDWDDPIMAPRERDLMFMGGGVANVGINHLKKRFSIKAMERLK